MKTLEDAIGCWTCDDYGLPKLLPLIRASVLECRRLTKRGKVDDLPRALEVLRSRLQNALGVTEHAERRLQEIISTKELER